MEAPAQPAPEVVPSIEVKAEEKAAAAPESTSNATTTQKGDANPANPPEATPSATTPAPSAQTTSLSKPENEQLDAILRRLSDARDPNE